MTAEKYSLSKKCPCSKYTVVYFKLSKVWQDLFVLLKMFLLEMRFLCLTIEAEMD